MPINYSLYHPKWPLITHLIRFKRADGKCERCKCEHLKPHRTTGHRVILATVHLDHDRTNNKFSNLAAFCQWCHLWWDRKNHSYSRKYGRETLYINGILFSIKPSPIEIPKVKNIPKPLSLFEEAPASPLSFVSLFDAPLKNRFSVTSPTV
jgi:hypothetical protein